MSDYDRDAAVGLANLIRTVDGSHSLGSGALADHIIEAGYRLPDGSPPQGLGPYYRKQIAEQAAELDRLRRVEAAARVFVDKRGDTTSWDDMRVLRAALQPEGSVGTHDRPSEYGRLLAERDRLIADGADPRDLLVPDQPEGSAGT